MPEKWCFPKPASCCSRAIWTGLRQAILDLAASPGKRAAMGREGRARFADQFRHETMTRQLRSLYERILELQSHPAHVRA